MALENLKADVHRQYGRFTWRHLIVGFLTRRNFRAIVTLRLCQHAARSKRFIAAMMLPLFKIAHRLAVTHAAMDLPWKTTIGPGFAITHGWGAVVSPGAVIGSNVTLFHGATLGRKDKIGHGTEPITAYPVIGDEVWIGPHAIIVGGVTIGAGSRIAGGAFVTHDIPPRSIVVGNPGKIVASNCEPDVFNRSPTY